MKAPTRQDRLSAAATIREVLAATERGDLDAESPTGRALAVYLAGAADALESTSPGPRARARLHLRVSAGESQGK